MIFTFPPVILIFALLTTKLLYQLLVTWAISAVSLNAFCFELTVYVAGISLVIISSTR